MAVEPGMCVEVVRIRPKAGHEETLLGLRDALVKSYEEFSDQYVHASLYKLEDSGEWVDVWIWKTREGAEAGLGSPTEPFKQWNEHAELVSLEWGTTATWHNR
jgi:hypothetical protein